MEYADLCFRAEVLSDLFEDAVVVCDQRRNAVIFQVAHRIPPVGSQVVHDEIEVLGKQRSERIVEVDGQAIAVAENEPGSVGIAMAAKQYRRPIAHSHFVDRPRFGNAPDRPLLRHDDGSTS